MLSLLLLYVVTQSAFGEAVPLSSIETRDPSGDGGLIQTRTLWSIICSCLFTIFLCTWASLHPNISSTSEEQGIRWRDKLRKSLVDLLTYKLPLFLCALLFPEYILAWAIRQYIMAGEIQNKVPGWTRAHGFFLIMGGFQLYEHPDQELLEREKGEGVHYSINPGKFVRILEVEDVRKHQLETIIQGITEEDLKDKGKGDRIAKAIVLLQVSWFVVQCIARGFQHLPLTQLEIVTIAYVMMNFFIYVLWWNKPRDVGCPIRIYENVPTSHTPKEEWESGILGIFHRMLMYVLWSPDEYVRLSKERKVPIFWASTYGDDTGLACGGGVIGLLLLGVALGGIHFIAWWQEFPTYSESILWRVSCIALVAVPLLPTLVVCYWVLTNLDITLLDVISGVLLMLTPWLYIVARVLTIVIAFTALRSLPSDAFVVVDWTTFIPHI